MTLATLAIAPAPPPLAISELDVRQAGDWDAYVQAAPEATFFHLSGWKSVIESSLGHRCHFLMARAGGRVRGVLPLVHVRSRFFANALISTGFTVHGGPLADDDATRVALEGEAADLAERLGVDYLEFRLRRPVNLDWPRNDSLYATFRKPLYPDFEKTVMEIPNRRRAAIRKGAKHGLVCETASDVSEFYSIFAESYRNHGTPVMPKRYFQALFESFGDQCEIVTVCHEGHAIAASMSFSFRDEMIPYYGGGKPVARDLSAHDFMYGEVMRRACEKGCRVLDFGRSKRGTGGYTWKKLWGLEPEPLHYEFKLLRGQDIPAFNPANPKYSRLIAVWRRLPLPVANTIGPLIARGLG